MAKLTPAARRLRQSQTPAEKSLWAQLANRRLTGVKCRRQQPIGDYIVDFVCFEHKLVIEVDGGQHDEAASRADDEQRTAWLERRGYRVIRFWNSDVRTNLDGVVEAVREALGSA